MNIAKSLFGTVKGRVILGVPAGMSVVLWKRPDDSVTLSLLDLIPIIALVIFFVIRMYYALKIGDVTIKKRYLRFDFPKIVFQICCLLPIFWLATPFLRFADYSLTFEVILLGTVFLAAGLWICYRSHADLGKGLSPTLDIKEGHNLVSVGIYRKIRHPMYLGFLLYSLGLLLTVSNYIVGSAACLGAIFLIASRLPKEEAMMAEEFGSAYTDYRVKTSRLIPGLW